MRIKIKDSVHKEKHCGGCHASFHGHYYVRDDRPDTAYCSEACARGQAVQAKIKKKASERSKTKRDQRTGL